MTVTKITPRRPLALTVREAGSSGLGGDAYLYESTLLSRQSAWVQLRDNNILFVSPK